MSEKVGHCLERKEKKNGGITSMIKECRLWKDKIAPKHNSLGTAHWGGGWKPMCESQSALHSRGLLCSYLEESG